MIADKNKNVKIYKLENIKDLTDLKVRLHKNNLEFRFRHKPFIGSAKTLFIFKRENSLQTWSDWINKDRYPKDQIISI